MYQVNTKYNRLIGITEPFLVLQKNGKRKSKAVFRCECGVEKECYVTDVLSGNTKSCGCLKMEGLIDRSTKHGLSRHPLMSIWSMIRERCNTEKNARYKDYGGRGIKMCEEWLSSYPNFVEWALKNGWKRGLHVDRKDNDLGYSPSNCRIVTCKINNNNKRNCVLITYKGKTQNISQWCEELGLKYSLIATRFRDHKPSPEKLFETPDRYWKHKQKIKNIQHEKTNCQNRTIL